MISAKKPNAKANAKSDLLLRQPKIERILRAESEPKVNWKPQTLSNAITSAFDKKLPFGHTGKLKTHTKQHNSRSS